MTIFRALTLALMTLTPLAGYAETRNVGRFIDVTNDRGGNVLEMVQTRKQLESTGKDIRIRGYCRSACTMLITMQRACLGPGATIGFHAPRIQGTQIIPPYVDQIMGNYYRNGIRERWFGGWNKSMDMQVISAQEYVRLDPQARICDSLRKKKK